MNENQLNLFKDFSKFKFNNTIDYPGLSDEMIETMKLPGKRLQEEKERQEEQLRIAHEQLLKQCSMLEEQRKINKDNKVGFYFNMGIAILGLLVAIIVLFK
jgi:beta-glucosidase/6-phospho-beta-glucosidase/beta-galactosidase